MPDYPNFTCPIHIPEKKKITHSLSFDEYHLSNIETYRISSSNHHNTRVTVPRLNDHSLEYAKHGFAWFHPPQFDSMIQLQYDIFADKGPKLWTDLPGWKISLLLHHNSRFCLFLLKAIGRSGCDWRVCSNNLRVGLSLSNLEPIWIDDLQLQQHICCWFKVQQILQGSEEAIVVHKCFWPYNLRHVQ